MARIVHGSSIAEVFSQRKTAGKPVDTANTTDMAMLVLRGLRPEDIDQEGFILGDGFGMQVSEIEDVPGRGVAVSGIIYQGSVSLGDNVMADPSGKETTVVDIQLSDTKNPHEYSGWTN